MPHILIFLSGCFVGFMAGILVASLCHMAKKNDPDTDEWKCRRCGCTEFDPCFTDDGPCSWIEENLCSACVTTEDFERWRSPGLIVYSPSRCVAEEDIKGKGVA